MEFEKTESEKKFAGEVADEKEQTKLNEEEEQKRGERIAPSATCWADN